MHESLSQKLRVLRAQKGWTLTEAARRAHVGRDTLSDLERGRQHPFMPTLAKIAQGYGVPVEDLLVEEEPALLGKGDASAPGQAEDPNEWLLGLFRDAEAAYRPDGIPLDWSAETFDRIISRLGETAIRAAGIDLRAGNQERAVEMLRLLVQVTINLEARKARLEEPTRAPERPQTKLPREDLGDPEALDKELDRHAA